MEYAEQIKGLSPTEVQTLEEANELINKPPKTAWSVSELNDAFDHHEGSLAIDDVLHKVSAHMGYTHQDVLASR